MEVLGFWERLAGEYLFAFLEEVDVFLRYVLKFILFSHYLFTVLSYMFGEFGFFVVDLCFVR